MTRRDRIDASIQRIADEHGDGCDCTTCRAAAGDTEAKREILKRLV